MPFIALSLICQVICAVHIIKTRQERYWLYLVIMMPLLGCVVYFVVNMLPDLMGSYKGQQVIKNVQDKIAPTRHIKNLRNQLALSDNANTHTELANELVAIKQYDEAIIHYQAALGGIHSDTPETLLKLAFAQLYTNDYQACQETLDYLIKQNPSFRSQEGHLLYAKTMQAMGNTAKAEEEYRALVTYYSGPDAGYYYALHLQNQHRTAEAREQLNQIIDYEKIAPKFYRNFHKACLADTRRLLKEISQVET